MMVEWLCPGLRPTRSNRPRLLHCKVILLDEHELLQDVLVSSASGLDCLQARPFPDAMSVIGHPLLVPPFISDSPWKPGRLPLAISLP